MKFNPGWEPSEVLCVRQSSNKRDQWRRRTCRLSDGRLQSLWRRVSESKQQFSRERRPVTPRPPPECEAVETCWRHDGSLATNGDANMVIKQTAQTFRHIWDISKFFLVLFFFFFSAKDEQLGQMLHTWKIKLPLQLPSN